MAALIETTSKKHHRMVDVYRCHPYRNDILTIITTQFTLMVKLDQVSSFTLIEILQFLLKYIAIEEIVLVETALKNMAVWYAWISFLWKRHFRNIGLNMHSLMCFFQNKVSSKAFLIEAAEKKEIHLDNS